MLRKLSESGKKLVNDQAIIRAMCPRDTAKWLARLMGIPVRTARFWSEKTVPVYRRQEIGLRFLDEYRRKRKWEEEHLLPEILKMAGLVNEVEVIPSSSIANAAADLVGAAADRIEAAIDWIEER